MLQTTFKIAGIAGSVNTAAEFISRLELNVTEKVRITTREGTKMAPIEVTTTSDVSDEEQFYFTQAHKWEWVRKLDRST